MKTVIALVVLTTSLVSNAAVTRTINGVNYFLNYDFDTADGECKLRGKEYASTFYSYQASTGPVAHLNADGTVKQLIRSGSTSYEIIEEVVCE